MSIGNEADEILSRSEVKYCPKCRNMRGFHNADGLENNFCGKCGTALTSYPLDDPKCESCGSEMNTFDNYCSNCGHKRLGVEESSE